MNINDIKTLRIVGNKVVINNIDNEVSIFLNDSIDAVQYHKGYKLLEEPLMNEVEFNKYQDFIDLWQFEEDAKNHIPTAEEIAATELAELNKAAKEAKILALNTITVTTSNGNTFDGHLDARVNMSNAIDASEFLGQTEAFWKMADNSVKLVQLPELKEALVLAIQRVGEIVIA